MGTIDETPLKYAEDAIEHIELRLGNLRDAFQSRIEDITGQIDILKDAISKAHIAPPETHAVALLDAVAQVMKNYNPEKSKEEEDEEETEGKIVEGIKYPINLGMNSDGLSSVSGKPINYNLGQGWVCDQGHGYLNAGEVKEKYGDGYAPSYPGNVVKYVKDFFPSCSKYAGEEVGNMPEHFTWSDQFYIDFPTIPHPLTGDKGEDIV